MNTFQIIVAGAAGQGSKKGGHLIAKLFNFYGFRVFTHEDYQSVIKGGHNFSHISVAEEELDAIREKVDFILALNEESILIHKDKLKEDGVIIYDLDVVKNAPEGVETVGVSLGDIIKEAEGIPVMKNTALIGSFCKVIGMDIEEVESVLRKELPIETEKNIEVAQIAFNKAEKKKEIKRTKNNPLPLISGNEAVALGALSAGLENYFAYPMTPSTGVLNFFAKTDGVRTFQPESEIGVINAGLGSAYSGRRTMIGTAGGGFALMTEAVSFSAQSEIPLSIVVSQRMGPATGAPTYQAQGDLLFVLNSGHGDMMRFVVAPGDVDEAFYLSGKALNIAWKYQMPSIVLLDKELSENTYNFKKEYEVKKEEVDIVEGDSEYNRYEGEDISPLSFPGGACTVKVTGYEHDKKGVATEDAEMIKAMHDKRLRKYEKLEEELDKIEQVKTYGKGQTVIVFWGSTKGVLIESTKDMDVKLVQPIIMQPFPERQMKEALDGAVKIISVETNATGQLAKLLRGYDIKVNEEILKYDGRPFTVEELKKELEKII